MKKTNEPNFNQPQTANAPRILTGKASSQANEELSLGSSDIEDGIQLERREAYTERVTQKLLRSLLENEQDILPTYNPAIGFTYENIEKIFEDKVTNEKIVMFLDRLTKLNILQKSFFDSVSTCPNCKSTIITLHNRCPKCRSHNIVKTSLTEHIPCGYIAERERYLQGRCPKCGNLINESDFRDMGRWYICRECGEKFEDPEIDVICRKCGKVFGVEDVKMVEVPKFSLNLQRKKEIRQNVASLSSISRVLSDLGFNVEMPGLAIGQKSGMQHHFSLMARRQDVNGETVVTLDHAVGETEVQASALILYVYKISEVNADLSIFVAIPKLNETAKKIAQGHKILIIEGSLSDVREMARVKTEIENRLNRVDEGESDGSPESTKTSMWKRPLLRRDEKKPQLIDVVPSIHPDQQASEDDNKKSFVSALRSKIRKDKETE